MTTTLTPEEREHPSSVLAPSVLTEADKDELAENLTSNTVPWLTLAVHLGDADMVAEQLEDLSRQELMALAVALAARCPRPLLRPDDGDVDEIAVERACSGEKVPLTRGERVAAVALLMERRKTHSQIAQLLHMSGNTTARLMKKVTADTQGAA